MDFITVILGAIFLFVFYYFYFIKDFDYWKKQGIPYDPPKFFYGSLKAQFKGEKHLAHIIDDLYNKFPESPVVGFFKMSTPCLMIRDPELIKQILVKDFNSFHDNDFQISKDMDPMIGMSPFVLTGDSWKVTRNRLSPGFTTNKIKNLFNSLLAVTQKLVDYVGKHSDGKSINGKELSAKFTTDVVASCIFGIEGKSFEDENAQLRQMGMNIISVDQFTNLKLLVLQMTPKIAKFLKFKFITNKVANFFKQVVFDAVDYRKTNAIDRKDFLNLLISLQEKYEDFKRDEIVAHSILFFTDGFETSSSALGLALYELAKNPEVQQKAREEVDAVWEKYGNLTFEALNEELQYIDSCINESMRIYSPIVYQQRLCTNSFQLDIGDGKTVKIKKGSTVLVPLYSLHKDLKHFPDPLDYRPERHLEEEANSRHRFTFLPFGEGPRICLAMRFAQAQTKAGLAAIIRHFEVFPVHDTPERIDLDPKAFAMFYCPLQPPKVGFRKRTSINQ